MSAITNNPFATGAVAALPGVAIDQPTATSATTLGGRLDPPSDGISLDPSWRYPGSNARGTHAASGGYMDPQVGGVQSQFMALISQLFGSVSSLLAQLASMFSSAQSRPIDGSPRTERYFTNAAASSVGDPHEHFSGTTGAGARIDGAWDSMVSHGDLLDSHSFNGGFEIATTVTQPRANGVTLNERVAVTTDGGATRVSLDERGSYDVTALGRPIALQSGVAVRVDDGETVMKNTDGSLTIDDRNGRSGSIETTLRANGNGGVDVSSIATNVDLGGYLVDKRDDAPSFARHKYEPDAAIM